MSDIEMVHYMNYEDESIYKINTFECLPECVQRPLLDQMVDAAAAGFRRERNQVFYEDVADHVTNGNLFVIFHEGNLGEGQSYVSGFAVREYYPLVRAVHLAGAVKRPGAPSGVVEAITEKFLNETEPYAVLTRTQNDRVVESMLRLCHGGVRPINGKPNRHDLEILDGLGMLDNADPETLIAKGVYGGPLVKGERRRVANALVRATMDRLDYEAGDAQILVGTRLSFLEMTGMMGGW